jgi:hypothetical protein
MKRGHRRRRTGIAVDTIPAPGWFTRILLGIRTQSAKVIVMQIGDDRGFSVWMNASRPAGCADAKGGLFDYGQAASGRGGGRSYAILAFLVV